MPDEMKPQYDPSEVEGRIYKLWEESGYFNPDNLPDAKNREPFSISLPPPNVTGILHMGHAFEVTIQDAVIRYQRMRGKRTLWLPGTDHAPIATESKVAKIIEKEEGRRKQDLGRDEFVARVKKYAQDSHDAIVAQVRSIGASVDWSREAYTFDEKRNFAVRTAFKLMYDAGLIYRGVRVINWDPKGQTVISDSEVMHEERRAKLYTFKYSKDFPIPISTTRPETKLGDTAVAVHPEDERYTKFVGREYDLEFAGVPIHIKIIADERVEKDFGTGAVGITPAHSILDFEIAQRHNLPFKQIINEQGRMTVGGENILNKKTEEARAAVVEWLRTEDLLEKEEGIVQNIATAERTGAIIEPLPKLQWFVNVNKEFTLEISKLTGIKSGETVTLKKIMRNAAESGQIKIEPERFEKIYFHWIDNLRDWCISRQLWFGHQIPIWYKDEEIYCDVNPPPGVGWQQDPDTLDTWFSSGLWTFSTLGWPVDTEDLKTYHPTSVMMPGYEILFLWVARMILFSGFLLGDVPFHRVSLHGIVRDKQGRKFSKSLNNGIDPLDMTLRYGTDALRMALVFGSAPGNDLAFDEQRVKGMKHFANKLWNIARFVIANADPLAPRTSNLEPVTDADKEILSKLEAVKKVVTENLDNFRLHEAAQAVYDFAWHNFADVYIEQSKEQLKDGSLKPTTDCLLLTTLIAILKLLHPFMPFITEEIYQKLYAGKLLMIENW
jgi:valyl-tRNA synthetase